MNYHNTLCEMLLKEHEKLSVIVGFEIDLSQSRTSSSFGGGDIDVYAVSCDDKKRAVIEVKSNSTMRSKFIRKQLPKYRALFQLSPKEYGYFLAEGNSRKSTDFTDIVFTDYT